MSEAIKQFRDPCEYNPAEQRAAWDYEFHAQADLIVGADGQWRLCAACAACAALPKFRRFKTRTLIERDEISW